MRPWLLAALILGAPAVAGAQTIGLRASPCPAQLPDDAVARRLAVELRGDGIERVAVDSLVPRTTVELRSACGEPLAVEIRVERVDAEEALSREVDLSGVPAGLRIRLVALSAAELLRAGWATHPGPARDAPVAEPPAESAPSRAAPLALPDPAARLAEPILVRAPAPPPRVLGLHYGLRLNDPAGPPRVVDEEASEGPSAVAFSFAGAMRGLVTGGHVLFGGRASADVAVADAVFVAVDVGAGGGAGLVYVPVGARAGVRVNEPGSIVDVGPRFEAGPFWRPDLPPSSQNDRPPVRSGAFAIVALEARAAIRLHPAAWLELGADVGWIGGDLDDGLTLGLSIGARIP